jgi:hypothetical protein
MRIHTVGPQGQPVRLRVRDSYGKRASTEFQASTVPSLLVRPVFFQWSPYELRKLLEHLHQHPGHVLLPDFAQSVTIREPSGRTYTYLRDGKVK